MRYLLIAIFALGCGSVEPDAPASKLNANPGANNNVGGTANNTSTNNPTSNTAGGGTPGDWGTEGPATDTGKSADGFAKCNLDDVRTDDVGTANSAEVPADTWAMTPVSDSAGRCGDDLETLVWRLHNCERIGAGLEPYQCDLRLVWMGREHTLDMIRQDYFRHDNPAGESPYDRLDRHGVGWGGAAENIATGSSPLELHHRWMDSSGHRGNILGPYSHGGIGVEPDGEGLLATGVFVTPR